VVDVRQWVAEVAVTVAVNSRALQRSIGVMAIQREARVPRAVLLGRGTWRARFTEDVREHVASGIGRLERLSAPWRCFQQG
jgi:hypothetical protein